MPQTQFMKSDPTTPVSTYILHVLKANIDSLETKTQIYVQTILPGGRVKETRVVRSTLPEWNQKYEFDAKNSSSLAFCVRVERFLKRDSTVGEGKVNIEQLVSECKNGQDYKLDIRDPKSGQGKGSLLVRLELKTRTTITPNVSDSLKVVTGLQSELQVASIGGSSNTPTRSEEPHANQTVAPVEKIANQSSGHQSLESLHSRLVKLKLENLKPLVDVMDEVSKIHPGVEAAWTAVSSLYRVSQQRKSMDDGISELVGLMNETVSFVEDLEILKDKLKHFADTVQEALIVIEACSLSIRTYLDATDTARTWKAFSDAEKVGNYKIQLQNLSGKLGRAAVVHIAHKTQLVIDGVSKLEVKHDETVAKLDRLETKIFSTQPALKLSIPTTPPLPSENFVGREEDLKKMEASFDFSRTSVELRKQRRFVLYGTGGMGKTQLALRFLDENNDKFSALYMIDASSEETIAASLASIGNDAGIQDADVSKTLQWLSRQKEDWILLFDNADDPSVILRLFFPNCRHGNILITTRNAGYKTLAPGSSLEVSTLEEKDAVSLLLDSSQLERTEESEEAARTIVQDFGCLALAVVQAGSYIATRHIDLSEYQNIYRSNRSTLLRTALGPDVDYARSQPVFVTWEISYNALSPTAQTLINICSFLYREGIAEAIFQEAATSSKALPAPDRVESNNHDQDPDEIPSPVLLALLQHLRDGTGGWNKGSFVDLMHELRSYSLVQERSKGIFSIHPLVHEWARDRMISSQQTEFRSSALRLLYLAIPSSYGDKLHATMARILLPHLNSDTNIANVEIADAIAGVYSASGRWKEEVALREAVAEARSRTLGQDHLNTLLAKSNLASAFWRQGRLDDAAGLHTQVLERRKRILGSDHPLTLYSMANMATVYNSQGRLAEAEKLQSEALELLKSTLGLDNLDTIMCMNNLAWTYNAQGRYPEAATLGAEALDARKRLLGVDHRDTLSSMANLSITYNNLGRWDEAEKLQADALEARKRVLGDHHPDTLKGMTNLSWTYRNKGNLSEAEKLDVFVLEAMTSFQGSDHPDTLISKNNLASTYWSQGRFDEAEQLNLEVLECRKKKLGPDHPDTLTSLANLASTYTNQGRFSDAAKLSVEVLDARKRKFGHKHSLTLMSMNNLACTYIANGDFEEAMGLLVQAVELSESELGPEHPTTVLFKENLAFASNLRSQVQEAAQVTDE